MCEGKEAGRGVQCYERCYTRNTVLTRAERPEKTFDANRTMA